MALVYYGMQRRHEDATMVHAHSSRSHLIVQLTIYTITQGKPSSSDAAPSPPGTPTRSRRTLPQPSAGHNSRSQSPAPKSKAATASTRRSRLVIAAIHSVLYEAFSKAGQEKQNIRT